MAGQTVTVGKAEAWGGGGRGRPKSQPSPAAVKAFEEIKNGDAVTIRGDEARKVVDQVRRLAVDAGRKLQTAALTPGDNSAFQIRLKPMA